MSGSGERLAEDIRKKLMAAGFPRKSEEILDAVSGFYIDWRFEKHPNHVTVRTFSQMFKDMTECKVYGGHLPASGEFRIYCVKPLDREFYFTEVEKDLTTKQDVVNLFKAAGFKESGRDPIEDFVDDMRFSRASEVELTP